jgi:hypothetical protein
MSSWDDSWDRACRKADSRFRRGLKPLYIDAERWELVRAVLAKRLPIYLGAEAFYDWCLEQRERPLEVERLAQEFRDKHERGKE